MEAQVSEFVPYLAVEPGGQVFRVTSPVTTVGRGAGVDIQLSDRSVSRLHAELVRRGPYLYVSDLGLSRNGTRVNGRPVGRRLLADGDVLSFASARAVVGGVPPSTEEPTVDLGEVSPDLTRRECDVLAALCRPACRQDTFLEPATARQIAQELVVTEAAVKQHLVRLYQKFRVPEGPNRRSRLANEVLSLGIVRPSNLADQVSRGR